MRNLLLVFAAFFLGGTLRAQQLAADVSRMLELTETIQAASDSTAIDALDEFVCLLAYYAAAPDRAAAGDLTSGPALMKHYANNKPLRDYLLQAEIAQLVERHVVDDPARYLDSMFTQRRGRFLAASQGAGLFQPERELDLEQIRQSVSTPQPKEFSLAAAGAAAGARGTASPEALVSTALAGLSDFIARRAQQELTYTFLQRLREYLQENDLNYLFPATAGFLPDLDLLNYKAILPSIRRAFAQDLSAVAYNFGQFLEARDVDDFRDPAVYNIFLVYRILDLEFRDVPLPEILAFTYGELSRTRAAVSSDMDKRLAEVKADSPEFAAVQLAFGAYAGAVRELRAGFASATESTSSDLDSYVDDLLDADLGDEERRRLAGEAFALSATVGDINPGGADTVTDHRIILDWLDGEEAFDYYEAYPSLSKFDELFASGADPFDANERRAAGLQAVRQIARQPNLTTDFRRDITALEDARETIAYLRRATASAELRNQPHTVLQSELEDRIEAALADAPHPALRLLLSLTRDLPSDDDAALDHLLAVQERINDWLATNRPAARDEKRAALLGEDETMGVSIVRRGADKVATTHQALVYALEGLDEARIGSALSAAYRNVSTFETTFGVARQVFFLLGGAGDQLFLDKSEMAIFQTNAAARQLLAGLGEERVERVPDLGKIDGTGLVTFLLDFSLYLSDYEATISSKVDTITAGQRRMAGIEFITNSLEALLNAPLFPTPGQPGAASSLADRYPLFREVPAVNKELRELFKLSQGGEFRFAVTSLLNLIDLLNVFPKTNTRRVVEQQRDELLATQLALSESLAYPGTSRSFRETTYSNDAEITAAKLTEIERKLDELATKPKRKFQENLFKYGTFMSDVVLAETPAAVEAALTTIALPPGSSQVKRTRPSSLEIGAYFGASLARERLVLPADSDSDELEDPVTVAALFVPVGFSYSRKFGPRSSFTLFGSMIDLGAVTSFRIEERNAPGGATVERLPEFNLENVLAPGLHLMYNFPRSPFTLGLGVQSGPNVRAFTPAGGAEQREARAVRVLLSAAVDVPLFRLGGG